MSYKVTASCLQFSLLMALLLFWLPVSAQPSFGEADQVLKSGQKALGNNLVALVWKDGKMIYQKQLEKEIGDFSAKTQAPIGSCSQWMTSALVMTFVDEGKLSLDDKISKYIPIYEKYMKTYITIRNCLSFTTGIQADPSGAMKVIQKSKYESLEEEVNSFASKREIQNNPGMEVYYSHVGFNIAGRVLEIIGKKPFDRLMQERIIRPLKMHGTSFADDNGGAVNPSGGAQSTANDYMNFLIMLLNKGIFQGKRVLSEKSVQEMQTPQFTELPVKYMPKPAGGWHVALGGWVMMSGNSVVGTINLSGDWAFIDRCRNYAAIIMVKNLQSEPQETIYRNFKESIDRQIPPTCQ
ncbi:MAG: serine hydrolase domain-containing protein [Chitinophagales bacterium]